MMRFLLSILLPSLLSLTPVPDGWSGRAVGYAVALREEVIDEPLADAVERVGQWWEHGPDAGALNGLEAIATVGPVGAPPMEAARCSTGGPAGPEPCRPPSVIEPRPVARRPDDAVLDEACLVAAYFPGRIDFLDRTGDGWRVLRSQALPEDPRLALVDVLVKVFPSAGALRHFFPPEIAADLSEGRSLRDTAEDVVAYLQRRGKVDGDLFDRLLEQQRAELTVLATRRLWGV